MSKVFKVAYTSFIYAFLYIPIAIVVCFSFNVAHRSLLWQGFSFKWYHVLFHDGDMLTVTLHSLLVGTLAATLASVLGMITAVSFYRYRFSGKKFLYGILFILVIIPDIVLAIAFLLLFRLTSIPLGFWSLLIAHITFCLPFVFVTLNGRLSGTNPNLVEAARDLGATERQIFFRIMTPLLLPGLVAGWLLSFTLSLDDVIISYFVTGPTFQILPLKIFSMVRLGVSPEINALCTLLVAFTFIVVVLSQLALRKKW